MARVGRQASRRTTGQDEATLVAPEEMQAICETVYRARKLLCTPQSLRRMLADRVRRRLAEARARQLTIELRSANSDGP